MLRGHHRHPPILKVGTRNKSFYSNSKQKSTWKTKRRQLPNSAYDHEIKVLFYYNHYYNTIQYIKPNFDLLVGGGVREELPEKRSANMKKSQKGT